MDGLVCKLLEVPRIVLDFVYNAAAMAIRMPIHNSWAKPTSFVN